MLELGLMKSIQSVYNYDSSKFETGKLDSFLSQLDDIYQSFPLLPMIIRQMLIIDQTTRFSFKKIKKALPDWEELAIQFAREPELERSIIRPRVQLDSNYLSIQKINSPVQTPSLFQITQNQVFDLEKVKIMY